MPRFHARHTSEIRYSRAISRSVNAVHRFALPQAHDALVVEAVAVVETRAAGIPACSSRSAAGAAWPPAT